MEERIAQLEAAVAELTRERDILRTRNVEIVADTEAEVAAARSSQADRIAALQAKLSEQDAVIEALGGTEAGKKLAEAKRTAEKIAEAEQLELRAATLRAEVADAVVTAEDVAVTK